jgi:hypothetical protein
VLKNVESAGIFRRPKKKGRSIIDLPSRRGENVSFFSVFRVIFHQARLLYITISGLICYWAVPDFGGRNTLHPLRRIQALDEKF